METIELILEIAYIALAAYAISVLYRWKKCAEQVEKVMNDKLIDEVKENANS